MYNLITKYIDSLTRDDINNFALKKGANLSNEELNWTYNFIKNNYQNILSNPSDFNIDMYRSHYSKKNFLIIKEVFNEYFTRFSHYL